MNKIQMKKLYKKFGKAEQKDCYTLESTTWDGSKPILIIFPKKITKKVKEEVGGFILEELDDHDAFDKFRFFCNVKETARQKKLNLKKNSNEKLA